MIEESDWQAAYRRLIAERQDRVGDPPTPEEVEALLNGELSDDEAARVLTLLAHYPEIARVMLAPVPDEDVRVLTDEERTADLAALRKRLGLAEPISAQRRFPPALAYAAALMVVIGAATFLYVRSQRRTTPSPNEPVHVTTQTPIPLWPDSASRGPASPAGTTLHGKTQPFPLHLLINDERHYESYRLDVVDGSSAGRVLWSHPALTESPGGAFDVTIPNTVLAPGARYRLILYGSSVSKTDVVATYTVVVVR